MNVLMVAAENGALPGGKVGGMGDVMAHLPPALAGLGATVHVLLPSYGVYHTTPGTKHIATLSVSFAEFDHEVTLHHRARDNIHFWFLDHALFADPPGQIYHHDDGAPFATDANLYALFCAATVAAIEARHFGQLDVVHLHDWHAASVLLFRPTSRQLQQCRVVYTIHNLSLQGQRPLNGQPSSLASWFGDLQVPDEAIDPRYPDCYNPMRLGIGCADRVHAVSPTYAREIIRPAAGEGLQDDLRQAANEKRLHGIINGCDYTTIPQRLSFPRFVAALQTEVTASAIKNAALANRKLIALQNKPTRSLVTSVGRLSQQKLALLLDGSGALLDRTLRFLAREEAVLIVLGTGDPGYEAQLGTASEQHENLLFLHGFSESIAHLLYNNGDLFLMPSSFEPCGISQMLAMHAGQPCLVTAVGGLRDTVIDGKDGFSFPVDQPEMLLSKLSEALALKTSQPAKWQLLKDNAAQKRFLWSDTARRIIQLLYRS